MEKKWEKIVVINSDVTEFTFYSLLFIYFFCENDDNFLAYSAIETLDSVNIGKAEPD